MTKQKRNLERRESTVREFRTITSGNKDKKVGYSLGISDQIDDLNKLQESNELELKKKLTAALEIRKMEQTGMFSAESIKQQKIKLGILEENTVSNSNTTTSNDVINMIMMQIANEQDPDRQLELTKTLSNLQIMSDMKNSGGQNNQAIMTMIQNQNRTSVPPKTTFESDMTKLMMKKFMEEPKSELDNLGKLKTLIDGVQSLVPQSNPLKEMKDNLKLFQDMGIAVTPGNSIEEKRLELEKVRMEKELSIEERKIDAEAERTKSFADVGGKVLTSMAEAFSSKDSTKPTPPPSPSQEMLDDSLEAKCVNNNCGGPILITNSNTSRDVFCPKCNQKYQFEAKEKKLTMMQQAI